MKSPIQRRVAIASLLLAPALGACGFSAQTDKVYQAAVGINDRSGTVEILDAQIVSAEDGLGSFIATLDNTDATSADRLISVTGTGLSATSKGISIPANGVADLALPAEIGDPVQLAISGKSVAAGNFVTLTLVFASGQSSKVTVPVVENSEDYHDVPLPSASPSFAPLAE